MVPGGDPSRAGFRVRQEKGPSAVSECRCAAPYVICGNRRAAWHRSPRGTVYPARHGISQAAVVSVASPSPSMVRRRGVALRLVHQQVGLVVQRLCSTPRTQSTQRATVAAAQPCIPTKTAAGSSGATRSRRVRVLAWACGRARWLCVRSCKSCGGVSVSPPAQMWQGGEPSPGAADVAGVGPVPVQMWQGMSPVPAQQMWQGWAQSRCRCGSRYAIAVPCGCHRAAHPRMRAPAC